jgi:hypothetical protein
VRRGLAAHGRTGLHLRADPARAAALDRLAHDMAAELGWTARLLEVTCYGLRTVLGVQDRPNSPINALPLRHFPGRVNRTAVLDGLRRVPERPPEHVRTPGCVRSCLARSISPARAT